MTENNYINKPWFDLYNKEYNSNQKINHKKFDNSFLCPCCYLPTLSERESYEICPLCNWEDDGQDNYNADIILGGPNSNYSLTEARQNFIIYLTSYRPSDKHHFDRTTVKKVLGKIILDLNEIKSEIIEKYNLLLLTSDMNELKQLEAKINELKRKLS